MLRPTKFRNLVSGRQQGWLASVTRGLLRIVEVPYTWVVRLRNRRFDLGRTQVHRVDVPVISVEDAGRRLARLAGDYDFTLFEYYHTDMAGHRGVRARILDVLEQVDQFLRSVVENVDVNETLVLVASDHGNIEDWRTTEHTLNPAFLMAIGGDGMPAWAAERLRKITDVVPAIVELLDREEFRSD